MWTVSSFLEWRPKWHSTIFHHELLQAIHDWWQWSHRTLAPSINELVYIFSLKTSWRCLSLSESLFASISLNTEAWCTYRPSSPLQVQLSCGIWKYIFVMCLHLEAFYKAYRGWQCEVTAVESSCEQNLKSTHQCWSFMSFFWSSLFCWRAADTWHAENKGSAAFGSNISGAQCGSTSIGETFELAVFLALLSCVVPKVLPVDMVLIRQIYIHISYRAIPCRRAIQIRWTFQGTSIYFAAAMSTLASENRTLSALLRSHVIKLRTLHTPTPLGNEYFPATEVLAKVFDELQANRLFFRVPPAPKDPGPPPSCFPLSFSGS